MTRPKSVAVWVVQILLALLFALQGITKLTSAPAWVARFKAWGYPDHFYLAVGLGELVGAILLLIPRLARFGALILMAVMIGAAATHVLHREQQVITTVILMALLVIILYVRRQTAIAPVGR